MLYRSHVTHGAWSGVTLTSTEASSSSWTPSSPGLARDPSRSPSPRHHYHYAHSETAGRGEACTPTVRGVDALRRLNGEDRAGCHRLPACHYPSFKSMRPGGEHGLRPARRARAIRAYLLSAPAKKGAHIPSCSMADSPQLSWRYVPVARTCPTRRDRPSGTSATRRSHGPRICP